MKPFLKDYIIPILGIMLGLVDVWLRINPNNNPDLNFLLKPIFTINLVEISVVTVLAIWGYKIFPKWYRKLADKRRAEKFLDNWGKFKGLLSGSYLENETTIAIKDEYKSLRKELEKDFNYFLEDIIHIQRSSHRNYREVVLRNFEQCWIPRNIENWYDQVQRQIPRELDCFDYILVSLVEFFKR